MKETNKIVVSIVIAVLFILLFFTFNNKHEDTASSYVGQELRGIKSLSQDDVDGLIAGEGTPFGGMAKLAELNGYPGPRHVLDLEAQMGLTQIQKEEIESIYDEMNAEAKQLGEHIIAIEKEINDKFDDESITDNYLKQKVAESAEIYGELRYVHLSAHLKMVDVLNDKQVALYNELRGYTSDEDPCENVPEGHDLQMWRLHHDCS